MSIKKNEETLHQSTYINKNQDLDNPQLDWLYLILIVIIHFIALIGGITCFSWSGLAVAAFLYWFTGGVGIALCFHRLLSHRSFQVPKWLEYFFAFAGTLSLQGAPIFWVGNHRMHHAYCDTKHDPYDASRGFWWSHLLWFLYRRNSEHFDYEIYSRYAPELVRDPFYCFLHRGYLAFQCTLAVILYLWGGWSFVIYGCFVRLVVVWHVTWFVNSACHTWGNRPFEISEGASNLWWVALLTFGEGWHNNHHAHPKSARYGLQWWEIDMNYWLIWFLEKIGLAKQVQLAASKLPNQ